MHAALLPHPCHALWLDPHTTPHHCAPLRHCVQTTCTKKLGPEVDAAVKAMKTERGLFDKEIEKKVGTCCVRVRVRVCACA